MFRDVDEEEGFCQANVIEGPPPRGDNTLYLLFFNLAVPSIILS